MILMRWQMSATALKDIIMMLDDPYGLEHVRDMRGTALIARAALKESE
jgi:hypothetical protein